MKDNKNFIVILEKNIYLGTEKSLDQRTIKKERAKVFKSEEEARKEVKEVNKVSEMRKYYFYKIIEIKECNCILSDMVEDDNSIKEGCEHCY